MGWTDREDGEWQSIGDLLGFASWSAVEDTTPTLQTVDSNTFTIWIYVYHRWILAISIQALLRFCPCLWMRPWSIPRFGGEPILPGGVYRWYPELNSRDSTVPFNTAEVAAHMILLSSISNSSPASLRLAPLSRSVHISDSC